MTCETKKINGNFGKMTITQLGCSIEGVRKHHIFAIGNYINPWSN